MATMTAPIAYFASDSPGSSTKPAGPYLPTSVTGVATASIIKAPAGSQDWSDIVLEWSLTGLDENSSGGIHIHYGTTCDTEATIKGDAPPGANKGHYYFPDATPDPSEDPWERANTWKSDNDGHAKGTAVIQANFNIDNSWAKTAYNRVVVVLNSAGEKVGCGVLAISAPGCGSDVTGGHYDPTFRGGGQYTCKKSKQWACEIGDQSGKIGKLNPLAWQVFPDFSQYKLKDNWMEPIANLRGRSMVLHCCSGANLEDCGARLACANLEDSSE